MLCLAGVMIVLLNFRHIFIYLPKNQVTNFGSEIGLMIRTRAPRDESRAFSTSTHYCIITLFSLFYLWQHVYQMPMLFSYANRKRATTRHGAGRVSWSFFRRYVPYIVHQSSVGLPCLDVLSISIGEQHLRLIDVFPKIK